MRKPSERPKICEVLEATCGGTRKHILQLLRGLDRRTYELSLVCSISRNPSFAEDIAALRREGIAVKVIPMRRAISPIADLLALLRLWWHFVAERPDIVHAHSSKAGMLGRVAAFFARVRPVIYTPHAFAFLGDYSWVSRKLYLALERLAARLTWKIVAVSRYEMAEAVRHGIASKEKIVFVPNGLAPGDIRRSLGESVLRKELGLTNARWVVGTVGRLSWQKGQRFLLQAAPEILRAFPDTRFLLVGHGEMEPELRQRARELGVAGQVVFAGKRDGVPSLLDLMDVFVLPSLWEGMPYALLEAMAHGLPIVVSDTHGLADIIQHRKSGMVVPARDHGALAGAVTYLLRNRADASRLGLCAQNAVRREYLASHMVRSIEELYASAVAA